MSIITEKKKKPVEDVIKHSLTVADLIDKLNELPEAYKSLNLVRMSDDGLSLIDKIEFKMIEAELVKKDNNRITKMYYEIKISSELGIKAY